MERFGQTTISGWRQMSLPENVTSYLIVDDKLLRLVSVAYRRGRFSACVKRKAKIGKDRMVTCTLKAVSGQSAVILSLGEDLTDMAVSDLTGRTSPVANESWALGPKPTVRDALSELFY